MTDHLVTILQQADPRLSTMKTLQALVGYLAVTALPFYPFSFASPLAAIDNDGYVDTTQNHIDGALMKHVLGTIVETCQTVQGATQNHKDNALMKRVPGDTIEARQWEIPVATVIFYTVAIVYFSLVLIAYDDGVRGNDAEFFKL